MTLPERREALLALAERCVKATGPDRNLDAMIHARDGIEGTGYRQDAPAYTASLDAAMTLAPEGCLWTMDSWHREGWSAGIWRASGAGQWLITPSSDRQSRSPALALCAAALRARSQTPSGGDSCPPLPDEPKPAG